MTRILTHDTLAPGALEVHSQRVYTQKVSEGWREVPAEEAPPLGYEANTVEQLREEIRRRNEDRDDAARLSVSGNKAELVEALEEDDARPAEPNPQEPPA